MPLVKTVLEAALKTKILALEPKLFTALKEKSTGLYKAQEIVDQKLESTAPASGFDITKYKSDLWETVADEWGKVIAKEVIKIIADDVASIVSDEMTTYIKSATITTPPGQLVVTATPAGPGAGSTTTTSLPNTIT